MLRAGAIMLLLALGLTACWPFAQRASVELPGDITITMSVRPLIGLHSDWFRTLSVDTPDGSFSERLFEDTGWWRGSNLYVLPSGIYVLPSGIYVLHEGQAGCFALDVLSPTPGLSTDADCANATPLSGNRGPAPDGTWPDFPPSVFHQGLRYVGQFVETPGADAAISFIPFDRQPEPRLPDVL